MAKEGYQEVAQLEVILEKTTDILQGILGQKTLQYFLTVEMSKLQSF